MGLVERSSDPESLEDSLAPYAVSDEDLISG